MSRNNGATRDSRQRGGASVKSTDAPPFAREAAKWKGYVNVSQSEASKAQYEAFADDPALVTEVVSSVCNRGYKITVTNDGSEAVFKATAYAAYRGMSDEGLATSAWAPSFIEAVAAVAFIVALQTQFNLSAHFTEGPSGRQFTF